MLQFDIQYSTLKPVHPVVVADIRMEIPRNFTMTAQSTRQFCDFVIICGQRPAFAIGAQVLSGIEAESSRMPKTSHSLSAISCAVRLAGVFDEREPMKAGDFADRVNICRSAVKMDGNDCARSLSDGFFNLWRIDVCRGGVNVHEDRSGSRVADGLSRGEKRIRSSNDFV